MNCESSIIDDVTHGNEFVPVSFVNEFDDQTLPEFWKYTSEDVPGPGCTLEDFETGHAGCKCQDHCNQTSCACVERFGPMLDQNGRLSKQIVRNNLPVIECGSGCSCSERCGHRLVQYGLAKPLQVFKTEEKGLGLRTLEPISERSFVCEYAGEVIGKDEARKRCALQSPADCNYIYVLKEHGEVVSETIVDPTVIGNVGRFINHSCSPNLFPVPVRALNAVPRVCLFARRDVEAGEELCYDYSGVENDCAKIGTKLGVSLCCCGSQKCRGFLPFDKTLL